MSATIGYKAGTGGIVPLDVIGAATEACFVNGVFYA